MNTQPPAGTQPAPQPRLQLTGTRNQCAACNQYFATTSAFERHRVGRHAKAGEWKGTRRCLTVEEMKAKGFELREPGVWVTGAKPAAPAAEEVGA